MQCRGTVRFDLVHRMMVQNCLLVGQHAWVSLDGVCAPGRRPNAGLGTGPRQNTAKNERATPSIEDFMAIDCTYPIQTDICVHARRMALQLLRIDLLVN